MHDLVVRDLEQARNRTPRLTDMDDPTLVTQHGPLMSPLVWDLALFWTTEGTRLRFGVEEEVPAAEPVEHVSYFEAAGTTPSASCAPAAAASRASYDDDPGWADIPDHHLLVDVADGMVTGTELGA
jgi:hypothetical protein